MVDDLRGNRLEHLLGDVPLPRRFGLKPARWKAPGEESIITVKATVVVFANEGASVVVIDWAA